VNGQIEGSRRIGTTTAGTIVLQTLDGQRWPKIQKILV
jgi:hypothetical protein